MSKGRRQLRLRQEMAKPVDQGDKQPVPKLWPLRALKTVFWSFFGVRKRTDNRDDFTGVTPVQIIIAGVIGAVIFVTTLITLVRFITR